MKIKVYSVFDSKAANYSKPWFHISDASAIREFSDAVNDDSNSKNQWFSHSEDFSLFSIGEFDDAVGKLIFSNPICLVTASALKQVDYGDPANAIKIHDRNSKVPIN